MDLLREVLSIEVLFRVEAKYNFADYNGNRLSLLIYLIKIVPKRILSSLEKKKQQGLEWDSNESETCLCLVLTAGSVVLSLN